MSQLLTILFEISLPIILLILAGFIFQKIFKVQIGPFTKFTIYLLIPIVIFTKLYNTDFTWDLIGYVIPFIVLLETGLFLISLVFSVVLKYQKSLQKAFSNAMLLFNAGNYGIPLIDLVFKNNPVTMASQIFLVVMQNLIGSTFGILNASFGRTTIKQAFTTFLKLPAIYALLLILIVKLVHIELPSTLLVPLGYISDVFVGFVLVVLGVQLADVKFGHRLKEVLTVSIIKVITGPILACSLVLLLGIDGVLAQALIIGSSAPTAVNSAIYAKEFGNEPDFAAQIVFATTVFCTFTLPIVILLTRTYF